MERPSARIRVVTICRNDLQGLQRTLRSVDEQSVAPFEHLILDGASTDGTLDHLARTAQPAWRRIVSEPDAGIYDAMNKGLDGDWDLLVFLNSGDRFADPEVLSVITASWQEHRWPWAYGRSRMVDAQGEPIRIHDLHFLARLRFFTGVRSVPHQATVFGRDLVSAVGRHRLDVGLSADQEFLLRCWRRVPPHRMEETLAVCDFTGVSSTQPAGAFARQMAAHRMRHGRPLLGSRAADAAVTETAALWDTVKRRHLGRLRMLLS